MSLRRRESPGRTVTAGSTSGLTPPGSLAPTGRVRTLATLALLASCSTTEIEAPRSTATFSESISVRGARAQEGFVNYTGAPLHKWTITLSTSQSCDGDDTASVEIDTVSSVTVLPIGTAIPLRAVLEQ